MTVTRRIGSPGSPQTPQTAKANTPAPALNKPVIYFEKRNSGDLIPFEKLLRVKLPPDSSQGGTPVRPTPSPVAKKQQPAEDHKPLESKFDSKLEPKAGSEDSQQVLAESSPRRHRTVQVSRSANPVSRARPESPVSVEAPHVQQDERQPRQLTPPLSADAGAQQQAAPVSLHERVVSVQPAAPRVVAPSARVEAPISSDFWRVTDQNRSYIKGQKAMHRMGVSMCRAARVGVDWLGAKCISRLVGVVQFAVSVHDLGAAIFAQVPVAVVALATRLVRGADPTGAPTPAASIFKASPLIGAAWADMKEAVKMVRHGAAPQPVAAAQPAAPAQGNAVADAVLRGARARWEVAKRQAAVDVTTAAFASRCLMVLAGVGTVVVTAAVTAATFGAAPLAIAGFVLACESVRLLAANAWCAYQNKKLARAGKAILPMGVNAIANAIYKQVKPTGAGLAPDALSEQDRNAKLRAADAANHVVGAQIVAGLAVGAAGQVLGSAAKVFLKTWRWVASGTQSSMPMLEAVQASWENKTVRGIENEVLTHVRNSVLARSLDETEEQRLARWDSLVAGLEGFGLDSQRLMAAALDGKLAHASDLTIWFKDAENRASSQGYPIFNQAVAAIAVERGLAGALLG